MVECFINFFITMHKLKFISKNLALLVSVFLVANLFVSEFFNLDFDEGSIFYSAALTIVASYLYKKHAK